MPVMPDRAIGAPAPFQALPPFMSIEEVFADELPLLLPANRISVTEAAERYMRVNVSGMWQNFDRTLAPYLVEPADVTQSRIYKAGALVAPAQCGKTKMLETVAMHAVTSDPGPVQIIHMSQTDASAWVEEKLDPTIENSPAIAELLGPARDDSTLSRKRFRGTRLAIGYPVARQLSARTQKRVLLTDYDHMPQVLGPKDAPEGSPYRMARERTKTFWSRGFVLVEGTPAFPIKDPDWQRSAAEPHAFPPVTAGIGKIYNEGTRARLYWECPECAELFEPRFDRLVYDKALSPVAAGKGAEMGCPHCGALIGARHKAEMNRAILRERGGWRHETCDGSGDVVPLGDARIRETDVVSYALDGAAAAFASWSELVSRFEEARRKLEEEDDELDFAQVHFTGIGIPYLPRHLTGDSDLDVAKLKDLAVDMPQGVAPVWTRFITVSVDVQDIWFPVQVTAWGIDGRCAVIDRRDLVTPPEGAPDAQGRRIQPPKYAEDWSVLEALEAESWPVEGQTYALQAARLTVDFQGSAGVSDQAEAFWRGRRRAGERRWYLTRGHGGFKVPDLVWYASPERASGGKKARRIKLLNIATDRIKDLVFAALGRGDASRGVALGSWMSDDQRAEAVAERRGKTGWELKPGKRRNEALDLLVQARAAAQHMGLSRLDPDAPPQWAQVGLGNLHAVPMTDAAKPQAEPEAPAPKRPVKINFLNR